MMHLWKRDSEKEMKLKQIGEIVGAKLFKQMWNEKDREIMDGGSLTKMKYTQRSFLGA